MSIPVGLIYRRSCRHLLEGRGCLSIGGRIGKKVDLEDRKCLEMTELGIFALLPYSNFTPSLPFGLTPSFKLHLISFLF